LSGGPGESHPRAPTERSVTVSRHSALLTSIQQRRGPSARCARSSESRSTIPNRHTSAEITTSPARPDLPTRFLPGRTPVARVNKPRDEPAPSLHPHYRGFPTTTSRSASQVPRRYSTPPVSRRSARSLSPTHNHHRAGSIDTGLPTFHAGAADRARAT